MQVLRRELPWARIPCLGPLAFMQHAVDGLSTLHVDGPSSPPVPGQHPRPAHHVAAVRRQQLSMRAGYSTGRPDKEDIDFGFKQVPRDQKMSLVAQVFSSVADSYDVMNDLMSGGLHRIWKDRLVHEVLRPFPGMDHIDVAGGTGDVAFRVLRAIRTAELEERMRSSSGGSTSGSANRAGTSSGGAGPGRQTGAAPPQQASAPPSSGTSTATVADGGSGSSSSSSHDSSAGSRVSSAAAGPAGESSTRSSASASSSSSTGAPRRGSVVVCDINPDMLRVGRKKADAQPDLAGDAGLSFVEGNAEQLPFADGSFDAYTVAFGIRNVTDRPAALREALRILKPGGRLLVLEFSHVTQPGLKEFYDAYSFNVIPAIGAAVANDAESYRYLVESIRRFPDQETFKGMIQDAGFKAVTYENLMGGIVAIHSGFKL